MKKLGTLVFAGALAILIHSGAWAQCPVTSSTDGDPGNFDPAIQSDADFLELNATASAGSSLLGDDEVVAAGYAAELEALTGVPASYWSSDTVPDIMTLGLLEAIVTDAGAPNHATICADFNSNLTATRDWWNNSVLPLTPFFGVFNGDELIAGLMTVDKTFWSGFLDFYIESVYDQGGDIGIGDPNVDEVPNLADILANFTDHTELGWTGTFGSNTNDNNTIWSNLGLTYSSGQWSGTAKATYSQQQVYDTYPKSVFDDGATNLQNANAIPIVPSGAPVGGPIALGALATVLAAGGALALRRKK